MLDKYTFGNAPAAVYLAARLNELNDPKLSRKIKHFLDAHNRLLNEVTMSHRRGSLSLRSLSHLMNVLRSNVGTSKLILSDVRATQLMHNVVTGRIKHVLRSATDSIRQSSTFLITSDNVTPTTLTQKSRSNLARKNKPCTYY